MTVDEIIRNINGKYQGVEVYNADTMQTVPSGQYSDYEVLDTDVIENNILSIAATPM